MSHLIPAEQIVISRIGKKFKVMVMDAHETIYVEYVSPLELSVEMRNLLVRFEFLIRPEVEGIDIGEDDDGC